MALKKREFTPESGTVDTYDLRWLMLNISAGMPDFRLRYWKNYCSLSALISNVVGLTGFQSAQKNDR